MRKDHKNTPIWVPSKERIRETNLTAFRAKLEKKWNICLPNYKMLHKFSIKEAEKFWLSLWEFVEIVGDRKSERVLVSENEIYNSLFFPDSRLNFAQNLLRHHGSLPAIIFRGENHVRRVISWDELHQQVSRLAQFLVSSGIGSGDICAGFVPNMPEAVVAMLACSSIGVTWTSCSPDFGVSGIVDRFGQVKPRVLFAADGYFYNGREHDSLKRISECLKQLPSVEQVVIFPYLRGSPNLSGISDKIGVMCLEEALSQYCAGPIAFKKLPFNHPLFILYSSGTTGKPKCIIHGAGGTLLQHLKEHRLHCDIKKEDRIFYFTTCGWMMWNWLVTGLASGATLILYDGSPIHPCMDTLFDLVDEEKVSFFGTSAKYISTISKAGLRPYSTHSLESLRTLASTGSPLTPENFDYVYRDIKKDVCLSSISGGTDIVACFVAGNPTGPVWRGEIQAPALGMAVDVFDEMGQPLERGKGELVCTNSFPSMPIGFWEDKEGIRYKAAYFKRFPNVWCHGDYLEQTRNGGFIIYGRSDATLNPGGVRIGTAEIYRQVEKIEEVLESVAIGQSWDADVRILLFVVLRNGLELDQSIQERVCQCILENCTPRHVPAKILQVPDIPRTKSGKISELAIRDVINGDLVENLESLENPESLDVFKELREQTGI